MTGGADETPGSEDVDGPTATPKVVALRHRKVRHPTTRREPSAGISPSPSWI